MSISRLTISQFRHLKAIDICPHPRLNVFYGENGSGKTSLLEAIYFLSRSRSFRTKQIDRIICHDKPKFTLFAEIDEQNNTTSIGLSRTKEGQAHLKIAGKLAYSSCEAAKCLPVLLFNQESFLLLNGGSKARRAMIDWGVFHQHDPFLALWQKAQKVLKQRNALLKSKNQQQLSLWDESLSKYTEALNCYREQYVEAFIAVFSKVITDFLPTQTIRISFYRGWPKDKTLKEALHMAKIQDLGTGYSKYGPHRADLRIAIDGVSAQDGLSRGQQKLLICAFKITQGLLFQQHQGKPCAYLLDDISSELDDLNHKRLIDQLEKLRAQVFITSILPTNVVKYTKTSSIKLFCLAAGGLSEVKPNLFIKKAVT